MTQVKLDSLIAPSFYAVHRQIKKEMFTHYWFSGGRGSTKSSFISIEIILGIMQHPEAHAIAIRKVRDTLENSVYNQLLWAIDVLGVSHLWQTKKSPLKLVYKPTDQSILFRGTDDPTKLKSIKVKKGYLRYIWYEELAEFSGMEEIRNINQSLMRGGQKFDVFYSYNPPISNANWVNVEALVKSPDKTLNVSTYLSVPKEWLGEQFFIEAEVLKRNNEQAYKHEYLGEVTGTGGEVFKNVTLRPITDCEINSLGRIYRGLDFGFSVDPCAYVCCCLHNYKLYIFYEFYQTYMGFDDISNSIKSENKNNDVVYCDSAEPRSIHELNIRGNKAVAARKGKGSVEHGLTRLINDVSEIIIDDKRCPNTAREFSQYEYEKDKNNVFRALFPDKNNHSIDAVRYALSTTELFTREQKPETKKHIDFDFQKPKAKGIIGANPTNILRR